MTASNHPAPLVEMRELVKTYRSGDVEVHAVRGVSLTIEGGEFTAIMGASGSGKSTLMNILGCLDQPTSGEYLLDGAGVAGLGRNRLAALRNRKLGFVFQNFNLLPRTSALENVELPLLYSIPEIPRRERRERATQSLRRVGLGERLGHHPNQLSGGQQQRVAIARALVNGPELLLADEPTGNLDTRTSIDIMGLFQDLNDAGLTVIMVTHEPEIAEYCKRTIVMRDGRITSDRRMLERRIAREQLAALPESDQEEEPA
jgi:putative ABC transport system ATP-binding protein